MQVVFAGEADPGGVAASLAECLAAHSTRFGATHVELRTPEDGPRDAALAGSSPILVHTCGTYRSLSAFMALARRLEPAAIVAAHPFGRYRYERPRADRIDDELGFDLRLIAPEHFTRPGPRDRPLIPALVPAAQLAESPERVRVGWSPRPEFAGMLDVRSALHEMERAGLAAVHRSELAAVPPECEVFVDHLDAAFGGLSPAAWRALASGAVCVGDFHRLTEAIEPFWPRPPVVSLDGPRATEGLRTLLSDAPRLGRGRLEAWRWAKAVASPEATVARFEGWMSEALDHAASRRARARVTVPVLFESRQARVAAAVIARADDDVARASLCASLRSVADFVDECVVVLDDRSPQPTEQALQRLGARVVRRRWTQDFAAARNEVHRHTTAEWLLWIDSDEVLVDPADLGEAIVRADHGGHDGVLARVDTFSDDGPGESLQQIRVYRREGCHWKYAVHNELVGPRSVVPSRAVFHASYVGTIAEKVTRSLPLLLREAEADPTEGRWAHLIAQTYKAAGNTEDMIRWSRRCIELAPDERAFVHRWVDLALTRFSKHETRGEGLNTILEALQRHPTHPDPWHALATMALAQWYETSGRIQHELSAVRTAVYRDQLPAVAPRIGLPLSYELRPAQDGRRPETRASIETEPARPVVEPRAAAGVGPGASASHRRVAFIEQAEVSTGRFLDGIVEGMGQRFEVRHVETTNLVEVAEAAEWADVVWLEWGHRLTVAATQRTGCLRTKPVVCRVHGFEVFTALPDQADWSVVDRVVFVAEHKRDILVERLPELGPKTCVIRNGVQLDHFTIAEGKHDTRHIVAIGHLNYRKGYPLLLQFFHELVQRDERFRLTIRGDASDPRYEMVLRAMIDELGLGRRVELVTDWIEDLDGWLADKSHVASFSLEESFHYGLAHGIAAGLKPLIRAWPEARDIWGDAYVFNDLDGFLALARAEPLEPARYRRIIEDRGLDHARQLEEIHTLLGGLR